MLRLQQREAWDISLPTIHQVNQHLFVNDMKYPNTNLYRGANSIFYLGFFVRLSQKYWLQGVFFLLPVKILCLHRSCQSISTQSGNECLISVSKQVFGFDKEQRHPYTQTSSISRYVVWHSWERKSVLSNQLLANNRDLGWMPWLVFCPPLCFNEQSGNLWHNMFIFCKKNGIINLNWCEEDFNKHVYSDTLYIFNK